MSITDELQMLLARDQDQKEFQQAAAEVYASVKPVLEARADYRRAKIMERLLEPERVIIFRVPWVDDQGEVQVNRGFRVEWNSAIGPYKGGLRFHPSVNLSVMKFLAFEQTFKNALTTLPMGGGKGGSDFNPQGKSEGEIMRFCQSFMMELYRHIGPNTDVPAGDIGVGGREIGFMFGMYRKITNEFTGTFTGKGLGFGGSLIRPEATGYGNIYFAEEMAKTKGKSLKGAICLVSGSGNVAQYTIEKLLHMGAKPVTASDSNGYVYLPHGFDQEKLDFLMELKNVRRGRIKEFGEHFQRDGVVYIAVNASELNGRPHPQWDHKADCAFPSATQNEVLLADADNLVKNGVWLVSEGANMGTETAGIHLFQEKGVLYAPSKATNAGGVAVSGLEMSQNSVRYAWSREEVDRKLKNIMISIHDESLITAAKYGQEGNYVFGANAAGFIRVAEAMLAQGVI